MSLVARRHGPPALRPHAPDAGRQPTFPDPGADHSAFPSLDGLRAVAVGAVVLTHAAFWTGRYERGFGADLLARMDSGVAVFFVISGFLLFRPWVRSAVTGSGRGPSTRRYAVRRALRILPAYWAAVALALLLLPQNRDATVLDWIRHGLLVQIYEFGWFREGLTQTWSLSTEVSFYVLLPFLGLATAWWLRRSAWSVGAALAGCLLLGLVPVAWHLWLGQGHGSIMGSYWLPAHLGWFAVGMAMAVVRVHLDSVRPAQGSRWWLAEELGRHPFTVWAVGAAALLLVATPLAGPRSLTAGTPGQAITKSALYAVLAASLVWPAVFGRSRPVGVLLANRPMRYLGDISYGVFLYHLIVLDLVMRVLGNDLFTGQVVQVFPLTVLATVPLAAVSFRYLERPLIRLGHGRRPGRTDLRNLAGAVRRRAARGRAGTATG
jgi:peptidoglycan/LPS O-acetylase OafA/YrhL